MQSSQVGSNQPSQTIKSWITIYEETFSDDLAILTKLAQIKSSIHTDSGVENTPFNPLEVFSQGTQDDNNAIQQRNIQVIKVKAFIEEMQGYLSLVNSMFTSLVNPALSLVTEKGILPSDTSKAIATIKAGTGHVNSAMQYGSLFLDTFDFILRNVRYSQLLNKIQKNLNLIEQDPNFKDLTPEQVDAFHAARKHLEFYISAHKESLQKNIFFQSTTWSRFALNTTNTILQDIGTSPIVSTTLSWAASILGIVATSVKFHHTRMKHESRLEMLASFERDQYPLKLEAMIENEEAPATSHTALNDDHPRLKNSNSPLIDQFIEAHRKIEAAAEERLTEPTAVAKLVQELVPYQNKPDFTKNLTQHFGINPHVMMGTTGLEELEGQQKKEKQALIEALPRPTLLDLTTLAQELEQDLDWGVNRETYEYIVSLYKDSLRGRVDQSFESQIKKYFKSCGPELLDKMLKDLNTVISQKESDAFFTLFEENAVFSAAVMRARSRFTRTQTLMALKASPAINLEKNLHEGKVANFNYTKARVLFGVGIAVSSTSLILSILVFCSVLVALPAFVFALGPLFLFFATAAMLIAGIYFIKKHRPSTYSHIYPAKVRYFAGAFVELIMRLNLFIKKKSLQRLIKAHSFKSSSSDLIPPDLWADQKAKAAFDQAIRHLDDLKARLKKRKEANEKLSQGMANSKVYDYMQAVKLQQRIDYHRPDSQRKTVTRDRAVFLESMETLAHTLFHPNVPVSPELIELYEVKMGINLTPHLDQDLHLKKDQYAELAKKLAGYFSQDEDDLYITMERIEIRQKHLSKLMSRPDGRRVSPD